MSDLDDAVDALTKLREKQDDLERRARAILPPETRTLTTVGNLTGHDIGKSVQVMTVEGLQTGTLTAINYTISNNPRLSITIRKSGCIEGYMSFEGIHHETPITIWRKENV